MKINKLSVVTATMLIITATYLLLSSCGSNPASPVSQPTKDYAVYFADYDSPYFYEFHTGTATLDSFKFEFDTPHGLAVSGDGSKLYIGGESSTMVVDAESKDVLEDLPFVAGGRPGLIASPDGDHLAILGAQGLTIVNTHSCEPALQDTSVHNGVFSADSRTYAYTRDSSVFAVDIATGTTSELVCLGGRGLWRVLSTAAGDRWFVYRRVADCLYVFEVFDTAADSTIFSLGLYPGLGQMILTPNERYLVLSQAGAMNCDVAPPSYLNVYDIEANQMLDSVSTAYFADGSEPEYRYVPINEMCVTPDGEWLVGTRTIAGGEAVIMHVPTLTMQHYIFLGWSRELHSVTCQPKP